MERVLRRLMDREDGLAMVTAVIVVLEVTLNWYVGTLPKATAVAVLKLVPVMVTETPPAVVAVSALTPLTVGATAW